MIADILHAYSDRVFEAGRYHYVLQCSDCPALSGMVLGFNRTEAELAIRELNERRAQLGLAAIRLSFSY